jgi:drug/metabolite transporter (DMT)-like permease
MQVSRSKIVLLTTLAMLAFAGNSILGRLALKTTSIDPATYMSLRLVSAAGMLMLILRLRPTPTPVAGNWPSALALFAYAVGFSLSYMDLSAGTGALLLFAAVQITMIGLSLWRGDKMSPLQILGIVIAFAGLVILLLPNVDTPPLTASALMIGAGVAWGIYSLRGRGAGDPTAVTAGNFLRTVPMAVIFSVLMISHMQISSTGVIYALLSGAITSGLGYAIWYAALPLLKPIQASIVQLSVPIIASFGGVLFIGEGLTLRLVLTATAVLGGILLVMVERGRKQPA